MKYSELNLDSRLNSAIEKLNYVDATPIQEQAMPHILAGRDVAGLAQTGTGKTAAFVVPLVERILRTQADPTHERSIKDWNARSFVLILVPTRELAEQIHENVMKISEGTGFKSFPLYGGTGYDKQKEALKSGLQFVVSTPGRLIDLFKENFIDLKQVRAIVFDEADRMFDMGFKDDMVYILGRVPRDRQFLVFSATLNFDVLNTAYQFGAEPVEINISRDQATADHVKDYIIHLGHEEKPQFLLSLLKRENPKQAMIFTNFKYNVDKVASFLMSNKIPAMGLSSLMSQSQRNQVIEKFKASNDQNILVATDVAARGLDITDVDLVINFEMPQDAESYVHRIGRTGRAGREGRAYSLICDKDIDSLARVEEYTKKKLETVFIEDVDLVKDFVAFSDRETQTGKQFDRPFNRSRDSKRGAGRTSGAGRRGDRRDQRDHSGGSRPERSEFRPDRSSGASRLGAETQQSAGTSSTPKMKSRPQRDFNAPKKGPRTDFQNSKFKKDFSDKPQRNAESRAAKTTTTPRQGNASNFRKKSNEPSVAQKVKSFFTKIFKTGPSSQK